MAVCTEPEVDIPDTERLLAEKAYGELSRIFREHYENAIMEAGEYIIKEFYDGNFDMARDKKSPKEGSLNHLIKMIQDTSSKGPSKSWFYNAVNLVVQNHDLKAGEDDEAEKKRFHTYGNLRLSHKVCLLSVSAVEQKKQLIDEINEKDLTVQKLRDRIKELKSADDNPSTKSLNQIISRPEILFAEGYSKEDYLDKLSKMSTKSLDSLKAKSITKRDNLKKEIAELEKVKGSKEGHVQGYVLLIEEISKVMANKTAASSQSEPDPGS
ncbi:uncharacterized protein Dmul_37100 [Desulfococcus multivorans]|nr:uncharacterized protein Dmul_37100 [Desulfococcus multivorans]